MWAGALGFIMLKENNKENESTIQKHIVPKQKKIIINGVIEPIYL